jgi:hypothetical protein
MTEQCGLAAARTAYDRQDHWLFAAEEVAENASTNPFIRQVGEDSRLDLQRRPRDQGYVHEDGVELRSERPDSRQTLMVHEPKATENELAVPSLKTRGFALQEEVNPVSKTALPAR